MPPSKESFTDVVAGSTCLDLSPAGLERAAEVMLKLPQADMPLRHHFAAGVCVRELFMPAGTLVIGHVHRYADINIMLTGRLTLLLPDGSTKELRAPQTFLGTPGQKIAYVHEDVIWQNVWPLGDLPPDVETVENHFLDKSPALARHMASELALERLARCVDRDSYAAFLEQHKLTREEVRRWAEIEEDRVPMPPGSRKFRIGPSAIEGHGVLATATISEAEVIGPARISGKRTPLGRYTNHAANPNSMMCLRKEGEPAEWELVLVAMRAIRGAQGGQPGEEITVNYTQVLGVNDGLDAALANRKGIDLCPQ